MDPVGAEVEDILSNIAQSPSKLLNKSDQNVTILYTKVVYRRARVYVRRVNSN